MIDIGFYIFYILFFIAVVTAVVFPIINAFKTPGSLGKSLIGVGGLVALFVLSYILSGDHISAKGLALGETPASAKFIGAGLIMFYLALFISVGALIYSEISKALK